jgi:hypothetical protein
VRHEIASLASLARRAAAQRPKPLGMPVPSIRDYFELSTHDAAKVLRFDQVEKFADGSGYRADLTVQSATFAAKQTFYFEEAFLVASIAALEAMSERLEGTARLGQQYEEPFIEFAACDHGHVRVSGEILDHTTFGQRLQFAFQTDQTVLGSLVVFLQELRDA